MMEEAFRLIDDPAGESTYLRLSTRSIRQVERSDDSWRDGALEGGYWLREPGPNAEAAIVAMGAVMPEALAAWEELSEDVPGLGLLAVTSPDLLHRGWTAAQAARWDGERKPSHVEQLLSRARRRVPASSRSPTPRRPPSPGLAACSASASRRWASRSSARPAASPISTPPTASTARRSPKRLPSYCSLPREQQWPGGISTSGRSATSVAHAITRTVTETDNLLITTLTHNPQPLHLDYEAAAKTEFGKPLVNSCFTFSLLVGVSVHDTTLGTLVANLGYEKLTFPNPVFVGDTLRSESECIAVRESKSRPECRASSPGRTAASTSATSWCANARAPRCCRSGRMTEPRSWLFVPADSERKIAKALDSEADAIIFDLEDSVAPAMKPIARDLLREHAQALGRPRMVGSGEPARKRVHQGRSRADRDRRHPRNRPPQGRERRGRHPARAPHRQHPHPRHRHRDRREPVRPALLPRSQVAARGHELGRRGPVRSARRFVEIRRRRRAQLHLQARALPVPRRRGRGGSPASRRRLRRFQGRQRPAAPKPRPRAAKASPESSPSIRPRLP